MALSLNTVFEVRGQTGNDTNGGGWVAGTGGTDYSQQGAKNSGSTDKSVTDGVTAGTTTVTSATANFQTALIGNIIYIAGGTGSITGGWYQVTARASATSITVDRSTGLTAGTGVTINIGGALATIQQALTLMAVTGMQAWVKADGIYSISTGLTVGAAGGTTARTLIAGYTTTRGDGGQVNIQATAAITMLTQANQNWVWENFIFDGNSATATNGINHSNGNGSGAYINITLKNFSGYGLNATANSSAVYLTLEGCEIKGCGGTAGINVNTCVLIMSRCFVHDNTVPGVVVGAALVAMMSPLLTACIFSNNSGAASDGVVASLPPLGIIHCVFHNNGRDGLRLGNVARAIGPVQNNIFSNHPSNFGIDITVGGGNLYTVLNYRNNAYYNNGADRNGIAVDVGAVDLTADPFTNAGTDFTLNSVGGGGLACRAVGAVGTILGATGTGYEDIGVYQHNDPPTVVGRRGGLSLAGR